MVASLVGKARVLVGNGPLLATKRWWRLHDSDIPVPSIFDISYQKAG